MNLSDLKPHKGSKKRPKRVGRGNGSGHGKTSCRGHKGQKSRSGGQIHPRFEGGQMPLHRRLPKRGFKNIFRKYFTIIHVGDLERFEKGVVVDIEALKKAGLVKGAFDGVKILSDGEIQYPLTLKVHRYSLAAKEKIEAAGGRIEVI